MQGLSFFVKGRIFVKKFSLEKVGEVCLWAGCAMASFAAVVYILKSVCFLLGW